MKVLCPEEISIHDNIVGVLRVHDMNLGNVLNVASKEYLSLK